MAVAPAALPPRMDPFRDGSPVHERIVRLEAENAELRAKASRVDQLEREVASLRARSRSRFAARGFGVILLAATMAIGVGAVSAALELC